MAENKRINRALILVELDTDGGPVHQVVLSDTEKMGLLNIIMEDKGNLPLDDEVSDFSFGLAPSQP